jgi:tRNA wybutosine-synthesizing protein 3
MLKRHNAEELDKAVKQGRADKRMIGICTFLNSLPDFFTSSSCSGRIVLLGLKGKNEKQPGAFHKKWHRKVGVAEVMSGIREKAHKKEMWLKLDPFIMHVGARNLESSRRLLECMRLAGIKRGGIILAQEEKFLIELQGTQAMALPVKRMGKQLVGKTYLSLVVKTANKKLGENYKRLELFERVCKRELKQ